MLLHGVTCTCGAPRPDMEHFLCERCSDAAPRAVRTRARGVLSRLVQRLQSCQEGGKAPMVCAAAIETAGRLLCDAERAEPRDQSEAATKAWRHAVFVACGGVPHPGNAALEELAYTRARAEVASLSAMEAQRNVEEATGRQRDGERREHYAMGWLQLAIEVAADSQGRRLGAMKHAKMMLKADSHALSRLMGEAVEPAVLKAKVKELQRTDSMELALLHFQQALTNTGQIDEEDQWGWIDVRYHHGSYARPGRGRRFRQRGGR